MKRFYLVPFILLSGCLSEKNIDPGNPSTFVKYYNGGYNDVAQDIKRTSDGGFILLATTEVRVSDVEAPRYKVKLLKTDEYGTPQWTRVYPPYDPNPNAEKPADSVSLRGKSIQLLSDGSGIETGYVVVGDSIQKGVGQESHLHIMVTDLDGNSIRTKNMKPAFPVNGDAVAVTAQGNFIVLGSSVNPQITANMFLAELDSNLDSLWSRTYGAGASTLTNKLFLDTEPSIFWSGTITKTGSGTDIRFVKTPPNSQNTEFDRNIGPPGTNETGRDFCQYGFGFAVIGTTNATAAGDDDIIFKRFTKGGVELSSQVFGFPNQSETGLAISQARDGGLIMLGSVDSNTDFGRGGKDYYLIKINAFGDVDWTQIFGSKNDDIGSSILSLSDGSYILYGTTVWGGLRTLTLIKTDPRGQIE